MKNTNNRWWCKPLYLILTLFGFYLVLKWTCRLLFGLMDNALLVGVVVGIVWYLRLPYNRKQQMRFEIRDRVRYFIRRFS